MDRPDCRYARTSANTVELLEERRAAISPRTTITCGRHWRSMVCDDDSDGSCIRSAQLGRDKRAALPGLAADVWTGPVGRQQRPRPPLPPDRPGQWHIGSDRPCSSCRSFRRPHFNRSRSSRMVAFDPSVSARIGCARDPWRGWPGSRAPRCCVRLGSSRSGHPFIVQRCPCGLLRRSSFGAREARAS